MLKKKILIILGGILVVFFVIFSRQIITGVRLFYDVVFNHEIQLKKKDAAFNLLLMGIGGGTHEGPELTDTIIVAHVNSTNNSIQLFSIPRDLWIPELKAKVNTAYPVGQSRGKNGILLSDAVISKVVGQDIDYTVVIDFSGFVKLVDYLDGIDVDAQNTLDDYEYPIEGRETDLCGHTEEELPDLAATQAAELEAFPCRYRHIHFEKGLQHLTGQTALEFVRSRHATGAQGTDFARSQRQHEVILAVKNKVLSLGILLNPVKVIGIYTILRDNINTDVQSSEYDDFIKLSRKMEKAVITSHVINTDDTKQGTFGLLTNPVPSEEFKYQWVLIPRRGNGDFSELHDYITCVETGGICNILKNSIELSQKSQ